ncbi:YggT family protein [Prochlorococcus marinus]|uniref:YggT family protein n=1 Tax=Prochlorococcus marinus TaxID=1219 RepID=UPI00019009D4|nr:YggT family protein [Prochlorococcus marinus]EEE39764.1 yggt family membrane protein [Prochlorococcus marinus str. MIT 9202]
MLENFLQILDISLGFFLSYLTIVFLIRLILTWYPKIDLSKGFWLLISIPSSSILNLTRKFVPPIGGVDVGPVIWIGFISFLREILVGQQGLVKLALHSHIS